MTGMKQITCLQAPRINPSLPFPKARNRAEYLDFNAVIVNLESMPKESQKECLDNIESNMNVLKTYLEKNIALKENAPGIPVSGMAVLRQQFLLVQAIEEWMASLKKELE